MAAAREIVLRRGDGYDPTTVKKQSVNLYGTGVRYMVRRPKNTVGLTAADLQLKMLDLQQAGASLSSTGEDNALEAAGAVRQQMSEMLAVMRNLALSLLSTEDADDLLFRIFDPSEENDAFDMTTVTDLYEWAEEHFKDETAEELEQVGIQSPEPAKKTAAKTTSRKPPRKKATARP